VEQDLLRWRFQAALQQSCPSGSGSRPRDPIR